jgi:ABC-type transport system involved in cytochrome bd biosynthesis fused ATPase/permease subunit
LRELVQDLQQGKLLPEGPQLQQRTQQIQDSVQSRDKAVDAQLEQARQQRLDWQRVCMDHMKHLSMTDLELLRERQSRRSALRTLPELDPRDWRFVVVIGPAGSGKSSFIREQLLLKGYQGVLTAEVKLQADFIWSYRCWRQ